MAINFPDAPVADQIHTVGAISWKFDGTKWIVGGSASARYLIGCFVPGLMTASQQLLEHRVSKAITIPANFGAYLGHTSVARGTANATGAVNVDVLKATAGTPGTFSSIGTIAVAAGAMVATFTTIGGTTIGWAQGDTLALVAPASPDATFVNFACTLVGYET